MEDRFWVVRGEFGYGFFRSERFVRFIRDGPMCLRIASLLYYLLLPSPFFPCSVSS